MSNNSPVPGRGPRPVSRGFMRPSVLATTSTNSATPDWSRQESLTSGRNSLVSTRSLSRRSDSTVIPEAANMAAAISRPLSSGQHKRFNDVAQNVNYASQDQRFRRGSFTPSPYASEGNATLQQQQQYSRFTRLSSPIAPTSSITGGSTHMVSSPGLQRLDSISRLTERVASARRQQPASASAGQGPGSSLLDTLDQPRHTPPSWGAGKAPTPSNAMSDYDRMMGSGRQVSMCTWQML
jgi:hypothetical protein